MTGRITCAIIFSMFAIELINAQTYNVTVGPNSKTRQAIPIDIGPCDAMLNITPETPWKLGSSSITSQDDNLWSPGSKIASMHTYNMVNAYSSREYVHIEGKLTQNGSGEEPPPPFDVTVPAVDIDWVGYEAKTDEGAFGQEVEYCTAVACQITTDHDKMREFVVRPPFDDYSMFQDTATLRLLFNSNLIYVYDKYKNLVSDGQELTFPDSASVRTYHMSPKDDATAGQEFFIYVEGTAGGDGYKPCDAIRGVTAEYSLTIYVDQPGEGGDRDTYEIISLVPFECDVGHTWWQFSTSDENVIPVTIRTYVNRLVGYYPTQAVNPGGIVSCDGNVIIPDTTHTADVTKTYSLTLSQIINGLTYTKNLYNSPGTYDLNSHNCTDAGIQAGTAAGQSIPDTQGVWPFGGGSNPGDLGEDLRSNP